MLDDFFEALRFLTVLPCPSPPASRPGSLARSTFFFPLVGALIAGISLAIVFALHAVLPENILNLILVICPMVLSGGLHLDGFADSCDGFFSTKDREDALRVMKDSRIGTWAAAGVALLVLAKSEFLSVLPGKPLVFINALAASRWAQVVLCYFLPAARPDGLGSQVARKVGTRELAGATSFLFLATLPLQWLGFFVFLGLLIVIGLLALLYKKRFGGITGDLLGAANEITELAVYFLTLVLFSVLYPSR